MSVAKKSLARTVRLGWSSLMLHKLRSLLTALGVLCGTGSVIAMLAIGEGGKVEAQALIQGMGSQNVILRSVKPPEDPNQSNQSSRTITYGLTNEDLERIEDSFPGVRRTVAVREIVGEARRGEALSYPRVLATVPEWIAVTGRKVHEGRFLSALDQESVANVCVLGMEVARQLFPFESSLGHAVWIGGNYYTVVGTLVPRVPPSSDRAKLGQEVTGEIYIPLSTGQDWYGSMQVRMRTGSMEMEEVDLHEIVVDVERQEDVLFVAESARAMLEKYHARQRDYEVVVPLELMEQARATARNWTIVLALIGSISLIVGGIGIMNVMLATVTERTREIGIRRALGAKRGDIMAQFLVETVLLSVGGGTLGILLGPLIAALVETFLDKLTVVTPGAILLAFVVAAGTGLVSGLYPAWRAAHLDPVEALRHE
jgi:putative ABC transport system permease protein